jgi:isopropylmalate/homocitrate/citramalate synthase
MGAANTVLALASGADVAHVTVLGIGERAGNAPLEEVALTLLTMYDVDVGLKYDKLCELAMLVKELSHQAVPSNKGVVGDWIFNVESGIIATWLKNSGDEHLLEVFPFRPELVGHQYPQAVLGKNSGKDNIQYWLDELGIQADPDSMDRILALVKQEAMRTKRLLDEQEFAALVRQVVRVSSSDAEQSA